MTLTVEYLDSAKSILGAGNWSEDSDHLKAVATPWRGGYHGETAFIAKPKGAEALSRLVRLCSDHGVAITPQGGNTGLVDGGIPHGEIVVKFDKLQAVRELDTDNASLTVEAGISLQAVQDIADEAGFYFPLSLASEGQATIGGLISTNAGGTAVLRYGMMRDLLLGVEAVMADGSIMNQLNGLRKNNTGYNLTHLLAGAEGTLGLITAATLRLFPKTKSETLWIGAENPADIIHIFKHLRSAMGDMTTAFEMLGPHALGLLLSDQPDLHDPLSDSAQKYRILVEISAPGDIEVFPSIERYLESAFEQEIIKDAVLAKNEAEAKNFWGIREGVSMAKRTQCYSVNHDISVPISSIPAFLERCEAELLAFLPSSFIVVFGHVGDGNLHYSVCQNKDGGVDDITPNAQKLTGIIYACVMEFGGSVSAEHGVGRLKRDLLWDIRDPAASQTMLAIKQALDPKGIFNPGRVI